MDPFKFKVLEEREELIIRLIEKRRSQKFPKETSRSLADWLYTQEPVRAIYDSFETKCVFFVRVYVFATTSEIPELQNAIIDAIYNISMKEGRIPLKCISYVWKNSTIGSKLRKFFIDLTCLKGNFQLFNFEEDHEDAPEVPQGFYLAVITKLYVMRENLQQAMGKDFPGWDEDLDLEAREQYYVPCVAGGEGDGMDEQIWHEVGEEDEDGEGKNACTRPRFLNRQLSKSIHVVGPEEDGKEEEEEEEVLERRRRTRGRERVAANKQAKVEAREARSKAQQVIVLSDSEDSDYSRGPTRPGQNDWDTLDVALAEIESMELNEAIAASRVESATVLRLGEQSSQPSRTNQTQGRSPRSKRPREITLDLISDSDPGTDPGSPCPRRTPAANKKPCLREKVTPQNRAQGSARREAKRRKPSSISPSSSGLRRGAMMFSPR